MSEGDELWDIGCDHSLLAKMNLKERKFSKVYCVDKSKASLEKLYSGKSGRLRINPENIVLMNLDGCELDWSKVKGSVVIAGVGAHTVLKIVTSCPPTERHRLIWVLNPFNSLEKFQKEIVQLLPNADMKVVEVLDSSRIRYIFKMVNE